MGHRSLPPVRTVALPAVFGVVLALCLTAVQSAEARKPRLGKEGLYTQTFKNGPVQADDTSISVFTRNRKIVEVWVVSNYTFNGGGRCWPIGTTGAMMPDLSTTGPVWVRVYPKKPLALDSKNRFTIKATTRNPFLEGNGSIKGKLLSSGRMKVNARLKQAANHIQGPCGTVFAVPKAKYSALD